MPACGPGPPQPRHVGAQLPVAAASDVDAARPQRAARAHEGAVQPVRSVAVVAFGCVSRTARRCRPPTAPGPYKRVYVVADARPVLDRHRRTPRCLRQHRQPALARQLRIREIQFDYRRLEELAFLWRTRDDFLSSGHLPLAPQRALPFRPRRSPIRGSRTMSVDSKVDSKAAQRTRLW